MKDVYVSPAPCGFSTHYSTCVLVTALPLKNVTQRQRASRRPQQDSGHVWGHEGGNGGRIEEEMASFLGYHPLEICTRCWWKQRWHLEMNQPGSSSLLNLPPQPPPPNLFMKIQPPSLQLGQRDLQLTTGLHLTLTYQPPKEGSHPLPLQVPAHSIHLPFP